jgi:hypothetical protein
MYKVGDEVILKVKITKVSSDGDSYRIENGFWFDNSHAIGLASNLDVSPRRLKVDDYVVSKRHSEKGVGKIVRDDRDEAPFKVKWPDGSTNFCTELDLTLAEKPEEPKPERLKVGDYVTSIEYSECGVGKIVKDDHSYLPFKVEFPGDVWHWCSGSDLTKTTKPEPEPTFKVGDKVIHRNMPEWGVGTVTKVNEPRENTDAEYTSPGVETQERYAGIRYHVEYPGKNNYGLKNWTSSDKYLVKAIL